MYWLNNLIAQVNQEDEAINKFVGMTPYERILIAGVRTWNEAKNRKDHICFEKGQDVILDPNGKEDQQPPILLFKTMTNSEPAIREKALKNFMKLL